MSLKQKYTWADFKREQGDAAKNLKRTSAEGIKDFTAAQKAKLKEYVKTRTARLEKEKATVEKAIEAFQVSLKKTPNRRASLVKRLEQKRRAVQHLTKIITGTQNREV